jgi:glucose-6-phosphate isomerase
MAEKPKAITSPQKENHRITYTLGAYESVVAKALEEMDRNKTIARIWNLDHTVWKPEPKDITNRLGWLNIAEVMRSDLQGMRSLAEELRSQGYRKAVLLGMGGSSLAPEVLAKSISHREGYPELSVLDTTDPDAILSCAEALDPARTVFIVSSKSGDTVETISLFKFFYRWICERLGDTVAGRHFIAITDSGSRLESYGRELQFRRVVLNNPDIGGRFSALSYVGLLPAALSGIDPEPLLDRAVKAMRDCGPESGPALNPAARLGACVGALAQTGRDKLTLLLAPSIAGFGDWLEQLIAESTGKEGSGILPIVGEPPDVPQVYGDDRLFVVIRAQESFLHDPAVSALKAAGHPLIEIHIKDPADIGYQFFLWEMATAVAGACLKINPFDQPNVESAKVLAREMVAEYLETCTLPSEAAVSSDGEISVYGQTPAASPEEALRTFLDTIRSNDYVTIQAFLPPQAETDRLILALRACIRKRYRTATTAGYGPRYLHSTGQLHKGDRGNGLFIQLTGTPSMNAGIPDEPDADSSAITFGTLETAQALGDKKALLCAGRRILHFHLGRDVAGGIQKLLKAVETD